MRRIVPCAGAVLIAALVAAAAQTASTEPHDGISGAVADMRAALQRGDSKSLASYYTEDADLVGPVSLRGRPAIERHMADIVAMGIDDVKIEQQEVFPGSDFVAATGRVAFFDKAGTRVTVLSYMTLWKRDGQAWRIHRDVSVPVAIDAAAVARMAVARSGFSVKESAPFHAVVLPMTGSYRQHGDAIGRLALWLGEAGVKPMGAPFGRYLNSPDVVPEASLQWEVGFPVPSGTTATAPFEVREIDDGLVAYAVIGGPRDGRERPWPQLVDWAGKRNYTIAGPAMEIWPGEATTEMRIAVQR
jgi:uncharacterized protein (TIGR02246 family)